MKLVSVTRRMLRQQLRDRVGLALTLLTAPFFVAFYWAAFGDTRPPVDACVTGPQERVAAIAEFLTQDSSIRLTSCDASSSPVVRTMLPDPIPASGPVAVEISGDASHPRFVEVSALMQLAVDAHVRTVRQQPPLLQPTVRADPPTGDLSPFDLYVPNLVIFALIMLVFSTSMTVAREVERGTLERLRLTKMRARHYLGGVVASQLAVGTASVAATFGVAWALGFRPSGSPLLAGLVTVMMALACIGVGVLTASVSRTVARAFIVGSFFMFLMVLFSGLVFPIPHAVVFEVIPTVHGARALQDVLIRQADISAVTHELMMLAALATTFMVAGGVRFGMLHRTFLQEQT